MNTFEIGQLVKCIDPNHNLVKGGIYKVIGESQGYSGDLINVEAHDEEAKALDAQSLNCFYPKRFEDYEEPKKFTFEVGDLVEPVKDYVGFITGRTYKVLAIRKDEENNEFCSVRDLESGSDYEGWYTWRFKLVLDKPESTEVPGQRWSFEITNIAQVDPTDFLSSLSRKNPVLFVDDPKEDVIITYVHSTLEYKMGTLDSPELPYQSFRRYPLCTSFVVPREDFKEFMKICREAYRTPLPSTGRRRVTVVMPTLK